MSKNSLLRDYSIEELEDGNISLLMSFKSRDIKHIKILDGVFWIATDYDASNAIWKEIIIKELVGIEDYLPFELRNKEQLHIIYVPKYKLTNKPKSKERLKSTFKKHEV